MTILELEAVELGYDIISVDDDVLEHEILIRSLRNCNCRIKCFADCDKALAFLVSHHPRYLFVDYRMPSGDGIEFIKRLSDATDVADINIYLTSCSQVPELVSVQARKLGVKFIVKDDMSVKGYLASLCTERLGESEQQHGI